VVIVSALSSLQCSDTVCLLSRTNLTCKTSVPLIRKGSVLEQAEYENPWRTGNPGSPGKRLLKWRRLRYQLENCYQKDKAKVKC